MIKLNRNIVRGIRSATKAEHLHGYLQSAIKLEHSTIPPYLTAMFSLKPGVNDVIAGMIRSIVVEEMLHLAIAANILVAIDGHPRINTPAFIPAYPGHLPMSIGGSDFIVGIEAFSKTLVSKTFMTIEEPEDPIPIKALALAAEPEFATIGEFYAALKEKITDLGDSIFVVGPSRQVLQWFDAGRLFPITDVGSAVKGLDVIVVEGEGTSTDPFQVPGNPAHYYKFGEIFHGRTIIRTPGGFAYGGDPIPFDPGGVYPMKPNPKIADFAEGTQARTRVERFAYSYSSLLNALHEAFNGQPAKINTAIGLMYELKVEAVALMQTPAGDGTGLTAGPSYEYTNTQGGMPAAP
jgi:hypothetical protein